MLGRYVSCSSKQVGAVVKSIQTLHFPLDWKKVQVNNKLHVYINMDRQSLTKQIITTIELDAEVVLAVILCKAKP